ncbi:beta-propeller domain-containing protein [Catenovulum sediminis]|uniref:beta-propeller domain-containing protein n=1 Tax=Catenovulum sediminis TaxID=1740262 RepID=UPI00117F0E30|nr:beta-propeller domain-containing protein [Catenovulum sediminis]
MSFTNRKISLLASLILLSACGGSSIDTNQDGTQTEVDTVPDINAIQTSLKPLQKADKETFLTSLKNGLYLSAERGNVIYAMEVDAAPTTDGSAEAANDDFSKTITQEEGVDEADRIKYDGDYLYIASNQYESGQNNSQVRVLKRNADDSLSEVASVKFEQQAENKRVDDLYLSADTLTLLSSENYYYFDNAALTDTVFDIWRPYSAKFNISINDVSVPEQPANKAEFEIDGRLITSRVINNTLYLVSSYSPVLNENWLYPQNDDEKLSTYRNITALDESEILPQITDASGDSANLVDAENCYLPQGSTENTGFDALITLTAISLADPQTKQSVCINTQVEGVYASLNSLYLYGTHYDGEAGYNSVVHQFTMLDNQLDFQYLGSAQLDGAFGWNQTQLRFSEYQGHLRVVTTTRTSDQNDRFDHHLYILRHDSDTQRLETVAKLPNESRPDEIGKANEDVYAVRYFADRAYVVTFERIDPLYVLDLADVNEPKIAGELEVTGFSSYLQPVGENLLLGIGQEVDPNGVRINEATEEGTSNDEVIEPGAKVALFDVTDISSPLELGNQVFVNGHTPVEYNYHALGMLRLSDDEYRFSLPVTSWNVTTENDGSQTWKQYQRLALLTVKQASGTATLSFDGEVAPNLESSGYSYDDRSVLHADLIYYIKEDKVWQSNWTAPEVVFGPY